MALEAINGIYQVLRNTGATLQTTFEVDGAPADPTGNTATVTITRADGTVLSTGGATRADVGIYTVALAPQANLDLLTVTWSGTFAGNVNIITEQVELVGGFYVPLAELQTMPKMPASVTDTQLLQVRREFEQLAEDYCRRVALVPRFERVQVAGNNKTHVQLDRLYPARVLAVSVDGSIDPAVSNYTVYDHGRLENIVSGFPRSRVGAGRNIVVALEHGLTVLPPELPRITKLWIRQQLQTDASGYQRDVLSQTDGQGFATRYSTPDWNAGRPTGLFDVDRSLNAIRSRLRVA